jgi:hypothetical protein
MVTEIKNNDDTNAIIQKDKKAPIGLIILSGLSFFPAIGVFFGLISIVISFFNFKRFKLVFILGLSGIVFSIVIYSTLYYFGTVYRGGTYDELRVSMNHYLLKEIDKEMINYKCRYGTYPTELKDIIKVNKDLIIKDPIYYVIKNYKGDSLFYYKMTPDSFMLFSVGFDGKPFTSDDIHPNDIDSLVIKK